MAIDAQRWKSGGSDGFHDSITSGFGEAGGHKEYSSDFMMQNCIENHASAGENLPDRTFSAHAVTFSHSSWVCDY
jgi:hypothetical protein